MTGLLIAGGGLLWMSQAGADQGYLAHVLGPLLLVGVGLGLSFVPMTMSATAGVDPHEAGLASGLLNTSRQVGGAVGLAAMATAAASATRSHAVGRVVTGAALTTGYDRAFAIAAGVVIAGAALALLLPALGRPAPAEAPAPAADEAETLVAAEA